MPRTATATQINRELHGNQKHYFSLAAQMFRIIAGKVYFPAREGYKTAAPASKRDDASCQRGA